VDRDSLLGIDRQHLGDEVLKVAIQKLRHGEDARLDLVQKFTNVLVIEW